MADIFDMDGYEHQQQLNSGFSKLQLEPNGHQQPVQLNYKLLDNDNDDDDDGDNSRNGHVLTDDTEEYDTVREYFPSKSKPISIDANQHSSLSIPSIQTMNSKPRPRRKSSIVSSYEIKIGQEDYISSSLVVDNTPKIKGTPENQGFVAPYKPKLSDFEPIKVLGKGSYGKVLLVREVRTGRLFASKQLLKASLIINQEESDQAEDSGSDSGCGGPKIDTRNYQRTLSEKQILEIVNHPNIVKLYYAFQDNNKLYLILEYLQGGELFHHLSMEKFMSERNAAYYIAQISLALHYLHTRIHVIYRDLKPENCMLNSRGHLVLTDFGLSKVAPDSKSKLNSMTGTIQYMAPEVIEGQEYDYIVDWWSLGCVAFDLLTGSPPFPGTNAQRVLQKIRNFKKNLKFPFYLSSDAKDLLRKLLSVNPDKRLNVDVEWDKFKKHNFFRYVDWKKLEKIDEGDEILPPILPIITDPILAENFDSEFTEMDFTPHHQTRYLSQRETFYMKDFSYINPNFLDSLQTNGEEETIIE
ncbi:uncharacterized protein LODBEIA_P05840 [Lodderomyces beijingensis]|uniref:Serine/threonine-protein kinase psk1 n=1 Tax=Lodderomyces beijingensis TaxID=1775926 RepID=A0ABP0ZJ50_9ASCO